MYLKSLLACMLLAASAHAANDRTLAPEDMFELEYALDPQISPNGRQIAYVRQSLDIMSDQLLPNIWIVNADGTGHRPLLSGAGSYSEPRWSPDGDRLLYVTGAGERGAELHVRWMDTGQTALLTNLPASPGSMSWSPDGRWIAFQMFVDSDGLKLATPPKQPEGAKWAAPVKVINELPYRVDGAGYLKTGYSQLFVVPADGGTPRQLTDGDYNHGGPLSWSPDSRQIVFSANRIDNPIEDPQESELWIVDVDSGDMDPLTDRNGPDFAPVLSPDGKSIAYLGFDDRGYSNHQVDAYVLNRDSGEISNLTADLDRGVDAVAWAGGSRRLLISYDDRGKSKIARLSLGGDVTDLIDDMGSASVGRPYTSGSFSVSKDGAIAYTRGSATRPSEVGVLAGRGPARTLTQLNADLFASKTAASVEEITWPSSVGDYEIQGWVVKPQDFDASKKYPLILEIHGGPFTAYGPHFSPEVQLYAAAGYVVLYSNPRGSTSYGFDFMHEIHHNYPSKDYDDLMSGVDAMLETGYIDGDNLFVTGGSGGGVLTSWIVGNTDRFSAAVVQKPVINWLSFSLTADFSPFFARYWFASLPWEDPEEYWRRSPLSLVGNVSTPTMLLTGEQDFRTPMSESEQYYQALKLRGIETALVRVPERSHNLVGRPTHLIAKATNIVAWFERFRDAETE
ncbi:MAG: S9 family peptidase [Woeseiaceae bacterium]|nr:S9 family peptidase [Woeseiaceae bacterium]